MNHVKRIPTGRELRLRRLMQRLLDPNPDIDAALLSGMYLCWGVWLWYFGVTLF